MIVTDMSMKKTTSETSIIYSFLYPLKREMDFLEHSGLYAKTVSPFSVKQLKAIEVNECALSLSIDKCQTSPVFESSKKDSLSFCRTSTYLPWLGSISAKAIELASKTITKIKYFIPYSFPEVRL